MRTCTEVDEIANFVNTCHLILSDDLLFYDLSLELVLAEHVQGLLLRQI